MPYESVALHGAEGVAFRCHGPNDHLLKVVAECYSATFGGPLEACDSQLSAPKTEVYQYLTLL